MNKGFEVFNIGKEQVRYTEGHAKSIIEAKLDKSWIKTRKQGTAELSYIGGHTVIRLLNAAFNYQWSFEIVTEEIVESLPKPAYDGWGKNRKPVMEKVVVQEGGQWVTKEIHKMEPQPPVAKVLGRLTVPGLGVKEQYGSKVIIGGATEQESSFKSASTDAMKKCASLFGIGLELYMGDEEYNFPEEEIPVPVQPVSQPLTPAPVQTGGVKEAPTSERPPAPPAQPKVEAKPEPKQEQVTQATPATKEAQTASAAANPNDWQPDDINRLKELKAIMGITDNSMLDGYVQEWMKDPAVTWYNIVPSNIAQFNMFLTQKAETI